MSQLSEIVLKIVSLNSTLFQEMCDEIILRNYPSYKDFGRSGMALGKEETKSGTPDSYILLNNDLFVFNEITKDKKGGLNKLIEDFNKCINEAKTGVKKEKIQTITFCASFELKPDESDELNELCKKEKILMDFWGINRIARNILFQNTDIGNKYLDIPLDKSQWVSLETFINNYNSAGKQIATPLNNPFLHRETEIKEVFQLINRHHISIISGPAGTGKSKLCVEVLERLLRNQPSTMVWVNSFDSDSIVDDLKGKLSVGAQTILFIDDAHRISHFEQILQFLKNSSYKKVKILVTVRDYAASDFSEHISEFDFETININRLNDEELRDILTIEPFCIKNIDSLYKILDLAKGNVRLALMLAKLDNVNEDMSALNNTEDAFDFYFKTFLKDSSELKNESVINTMALITFFRSINLNSIDFDNFLNTFNQNKNDFLSNVELLRKSELISIYKEEIKVVEQNLGIYFFNKAFFKLKSLNFEILLFNYFPKYDYRFKDCVISSNNNFNHENVVEAIKSILLNFARSSKTNLLGFYELFWFIIPDQTIEYMLELGLQGDPKQVEKYKFTFETNEFSSPKRNIFSLLSHFSRRPSIYLKNALLATLEFVRRNPEKASELHYTIKEYLSFDYQDVQYGYYKQKTLLDIILKAADEEKQLEKELFYVVGKMLLKHKFQQVKPIYGNSLSIYSYEVKKGTLIEELRDDIWNRVFKHFDAYKNESLELLESCASMHPDNNLELMKYDLEFILKIIVEKLNAEVFEHCRYVQKQIWWCKRSKVNHRLFKELSISFNCELYQFYKILDRQKLNGVHRYELDDKLDHNIYEGKKNNEIKAYVISRYSKDPELLYKDYRYLYEATNAKWSISGNSFDISVNSIFDIDFKKGIELLETIIKDNNQVNYIPYLPFSNFLCEEEKSLEIFETISKGDYHGKTHTLLSYFERLNVKKLYHKTSIDIVEWAQTASENFSISFEDLEKYLKTDPKFFHKILSILNKKMKEGLRIYFYGSLFEKYVNLFTDDIKILKETYLLQDFTEPHFDYDSKGLEQLCIFYPEFLLEYFEYYYSVPEYKRPNREHRDKYNFIWENEGLIERMDSILDYIIDKENYFGINDHPAGNLFELLKPEESKKALSFLKAYMIKNTNSPEHLTVVMDIIHKKFPNEKECFIKTHLTKNKDKAIFEKVRWIYQQAVWSGNVDPDLIRVKRWEEVLGYVNSLPEDIMLLPIQNYIKENIERYNEYSRRNKKR
jgi:hypothetical protein